MKKVPSREQIGLILVAATIVTNPLTGQFVLEAIEWVFQQMFIYGSWITLLTAVYMAGLLGYYQYRSSRLNIPKKSKTQKYIET